MQSSAIFATPGFGAGSNVILIPPEDEVRKTPPTQEVAAGGPGRSPMFVFTPPEVPSLRGLIAMQGERAVDWMFADPEVKSSVFTFINSVLADALQHSPAVQRQVDTAASPADAANAEDADRADVICEAVRRNHQRLGDSLKIVLFDMLLTAMKYGASAALKISTFPTTGIDRAKEMTDRVTVKPRSSWAFGVDKFNNVDGMYVWDDDGKRILTKRDRWMILSWFPHDNDPGGTLALEAVLGPQSFKRRLWKQYWDYIDQWANPGLKGNVGEDARDQVPRNADGTDVSGARPVPATSVLTDGMKNFRSSTIIAMPFGWDVNPIEVKGSGEVYNSAFTMCNMEIVTAILHVTRMTMEAQHGSKADSGTAQDVYGLWVRMGKTLVCNTIGRDLDRPFVLENFGPEAAERFVPRVSLGRVEHQDLAAMLNALASAYGAGMIPEALLPYLFQFLGLYFGDSRVFEGMSDKKLQQAIQLETVKADAKAKNKPAPVQPARTP